MLKKAIKRLVEKSGYQVVGRKGAYGEKRSIIGLIRQEQINLVLDVGANTGQFVDELLATGYRGRIISFEPLSGAHAALSRRAAKYPNWTVADRGAVGSEEKIVEIHIARNGASSSLLPMLPTHSEAAPEINYVGKETVTVRRLDDICPLSPTDRVLLKIDVQGFEREVLLGAPRVLGACRAIISEMSLAPLYEGQVLAREMWELLDQKGFDTWSLEPGFRHPVTGRLLQLDGYFVRRSEKVD